MEGNFVLLLAWILALAFCTSAQSNNPRQNLNGRSQPGATPNGWSLWSGWTKCSRTCSGGVREQFRHCQRSRNANGDTAMNNAVCLGANKRYQPCNRQPCPNGRLVTTVDQCAEYNLREFGGKKYFWQPMDRGGPCQLFCSARGHRFFLRRSTTITDGMECAPRGKTTALANRGLQRMCIDGRCVVLGCDGQIASGMKVDKCGECGGKGASCTYEDGHYRHQPATNGFHLVKVIPAGAKFIRITEDGASPSYLALRSANPSKTMYVNAEVNEGRPDPSKRYLIAGTTFTYDRPFNSDKGESLIGDGPTNEPLEVLVFYQGGHPGIRYEFIIPKQMAPPSGNPQPNLRENQRLDAGGDLNLNNPYNPSPVHPPVSRPRAYPDPPPYRTPLRNGYYGRRGRLFTHGRIGTNRNAPFWGRRTSVDDVDTSVDPADGNTNTRRSLQIINRQQTIDGSTAWVKRGYGPCSQSCAQGVKTQRFVCLVQSTRQVLDDSQCVGPKPTPKIKQCNSQPCPPFYDVGSWSECSRSCGRGRRTRRVVCRQRFAGNFTSAVMYQKCGRLSRPNNHEHCQIQECARWEVAGEWSKCNVKCGSGSQTRQTECRDGEGRAVPEAACSNARRPSHVRQCDAGPCVTKWFVTRWRECSSDCDRGVQRRNVLCLNTASSPAGCPARTQPNETRACARTSCGIKYEWFAGKWGPCSSKCGAGVQERRVICLRVNPDGSTGSTEETDGELPCPASEKPDVQQPCNTQSCGSRWYHTQWTECTASCNGGTRSRDVQCLDEHGRYSDLCAENERPRDTERCNTANCISVQDPNCTDRLRNCQLVLRARFCSYTYYRTMCCLTCSLHHGSADSTITFRK